MKILKVINHKEDEEFISDSLFTIGLCLTIGSEKIYGVYLVFNSPIKFKSNYISCDTFENMYGVCNNKYLWMIRNRPNGKITTLYNKVTTPQH